MVSISVTVQEEITRSSTPETCQCETFNIYIPSTHSHTHSYIFTHSHSLTHTQSHSHTHSHTVIHTLTHSHTHTHTHSNTTHKSILQHVSTVHKPTHSHKLTHSHTHTHTHTLHISRFGNTFRQFTNHHQATSFKEYSINKT